MQRSGATNSGVQGVSLYERTRWLARAFLLPTASLESRCRSEVQVHSALPTGAL